MAATIYFKGVETKSFQLNLKSSSLSTFVNNLLSWNDKQFPRLFPRGEFFFGAKEHRFNVVASHCWTITGADKRQIGLFISAQFNRYRIEEENYDEKVRADKNSFTTVAVMRFSFSDIAMTGLDCPMKNCFNY